MGFFGGVPWYRPMEFAYAKVLLRSTEGPAEVLGRAKEMRARGIDLEEAESVLRMQMFSMLFHASTAVALFAFPVLFVEDPRDSAAVWGLLMVGVVLCCVYLGCGFAYVVDLIRAKFTPYEYLGDPKFTAMPLWAFWVIASGSGGALFAIVL